ncbi:amidase [Cereibacter changlensis JA139]|uniref:Amidase n=2 Tax=Cereibacter changlensis TaxID=402884 RepID=A0A2T4JM95_9RHOB|nr:amidase [Cereibacter changlensis]PTE19029.1 amidase [Cereibacter changlensis JA139]PZX51172.1 aspartyl-tRNA(Asn)/glutamyl-tRNA(Gln) amidotransferase subunit A [Cereibacter changlensis]
MTALNELTAARMIEGFASGTLSPVEVTRDVLAQIDRCEPQLKGMWTVDHDLALDAARRSEQRWRQGAQIMSNGVLLDGVPITIKENIATEGVPMPLGTAVSDMTPRAEDAPPAARMRAAGAVFLGRTTMPDFGMLSSGLSSFHALARNPWNTAMNPGGSSAGAGVAGAAGYGPIHLGTDIGGSIRLPAAWCGLVGLKPSLGRVPIDPPFMGRAAGPMTRSVRDAAMAMAVLSQPDVRDHMSLPPQPLDWLDLERDLAGLRVGLQLEPGCGMPVDPQVTEAVAAAARLFEQAGAVVEILDPWMTPELLQGLDNFWRTRAGLDVQALDPAQRAAVLPLIREWAESGLGKSGEAVFRAYAATVEIRRRTVAATAHLDLMLSPVSPNVSFPADWAYPADNDVNRAMTHIGFTAPYNISEQPAISVPCGHDSAGVPIGLQIAGPRFDDLGVLRAARAWERIAPAPRPWPFAAG